MGQKILLIQEESGFRTMIRNMLRGEGYQVEESSEVPEAFDRASKDNFDLIIFDSGLPGNNGSGAGQDLPELSRPIPILMLTSRNIPPAKFPMLSPGAVGSMAKPFGMNELLARVEAMLRSSAAEAGTPTVPYVLGNIQVNPEGTEVRRDGIPIRLSAREKKLLTFFLRQRGTTFSRARLLQEVWGRTGALDTRIVDIYVLRLRRKLEENPKQPSWLVTIHGEGYKLNR